MVRGGEVFDGRVRLELQSFSCMLHYNVRKASLIGILARLELQSCKPFLYSVILRKKAGSYKTSNHFYFRTCPTDFELSAETFLIGKDKDYDTSLKIVRNMRDTVQGIRYSERYTGTKLAVVASCFGKTKVSARKVAFNLKVWMSRV